MSISLATALHNLTLQHLKLHAGLLMLDDPPALKVELVKLIDQRLKADLRTLWDALEDDQKHAVSETLYASDGVFHLARFKAKYGKLPDGYGWNAGQKPPLLRLFLYPGVSGLEIPDDIKALLLPFVPEPELLQLIGFSENPQSFEVAPHTVCAREHAAQLELQNVLGLIATGKVAIGQKALRAATAALTDSGGLLVDGDYYPAEQNAKTVKAIGPIRAVAWPLLLSAANLTEAQGKRFVLTDAGVRALHDPAPVLLRYIWQCWLQSSLLDEFQRISEIKSKGGGFMTALPPRRAAVVAVLSHCPLGRWVQVDEFWRYMQAAGIDFEVTRNFWDLYVADPDHGCLGSQASLEWSALYGRYILAFLFEYVATLGLIDVAYVSPEGARKDFDKLWGCENLPFLSRYDGLCYFRLNDLGAYCLGMTDEYKPREQQEQAEIAVMPGLQVKVLAGELSPAATLLLDTYAENEAPGVWRLSRSKALVAVERGHQIVELRQFLEACDEQPLPETVDGFISSIQRQAQALRNQGSALLIECVDESTAEAIATNGCTKSLCQRIGSKNLVVLTELEEPFRQAIHLLGYGMPRI